MNSQISEKYSHAADYSFWAKQALAEMVRQIPEAQFDEEGMMKKGVIVRHLLLPGCRKDSKAVLKYLLETYKDQIYISLMNQYTPNDWNSEISGIESKNYSKRIRMAD